MRYKSGHRQYSYSSKVPWKVISDDRESLAYTFNTLINASLSDVERTSIRTFRSSSKCRFTVVFSTKQVNPEQIWLVIEDSVKKALETVVMNKNT